jgi:hypothetical protein
VKTINTLSIGIYTDEKKKKQAIHEETFIRKSLLQKKEVNATSTEARLAPGSCTVE